MKTNLKVISVLKSAQNAGNEVLFNLDNIEKNLTSSFKSANLKKNTIVKKLEEKGAANIARNNNDFAKVLILLKETYNFYNELINKKDLESRADAITARYLSLVYVKWLKAAEQKIKFSVLDDITLQKWKILNTIERIEVKKQDAINSLLDMKEYDEEVTFNKVNQYLTNVLQAKYLSSFLSNHKEVEDDIEDYFVKNLSLLSRIEIATVRLFFRNNIDYVF